MEPGGLDETRGRAPGCVARGGARTARAVGRGLVGALAAGAAAGWLRPEAARAAALAAGPTERIDHVLLVLRVGLAIAGLALYLAGLRRRQRGLLEPRHSGRRLLLVCVALLAFAANYNLFLWTGIHRHEFYHYYLGSKYFPELGYFDLYTCSVEAVRSEGGEVPGSAEMTDLRSKRRLTVARVMATAPDCPSAFTPARWERFRADVEAFRDWMGDAGWRGVLRDHGYNPSPAWTLVGRPLASLVPPRPAALWVLARIDLLLLLVLFGAIARVFGLEAACVGAIAWGACGHTRYQWTGDAFLRQLWLATSVGAVCALARGRFALGGSLLAASTLERVFPGALFLGYGVREIGWWIRARTVTPGFGRFVAGAGITSLIVFGAATWVAGRGIEAWSGFAENTRGMLALTPQNALGLDYALSFTTVPPPGGLPADRIAREDVIQAYRRRMLGSRAPWRAALLGVFGLLFGGAAWRGAARGPDGMPRLAAWESVAMGSAAIPFLTMPASYYVGFIVMGAMLATRRPAIGVALLAAVVGLALPLVLYPGRAIGFATSSWALLGYSAWLLAALWRPAAPVVSPTPSAVASARGGVASRSE
jgi:hypothetical protein